MVHQTRAHFHVVIRQQHAGFFKLMSRQESAWVCPAFVIDTRVDVKLEVVKEIAGHVCEPGWAISVNAYRQAGNPRVVKEWPKFEIMVGMMMRDEDVPQPVQCNSGGYQLLRHAVTAVDEIRHVVDQNQRRGITSTCLADSRPTFRAQ